MKNSLMIGLLATLWFVPACGDGDGNDDDASSEKSACEAICEDASSCEGAEDFDMDACTDQCEESFEAAVDLGCESEYQAAMDCLDVCDPAASLEDCEDENTALLDCTTEE